MFVFDFSLFGLLFGAGETDTSEPESELDPESLSLSLELDDELLLLLSLDELELSLDELELELAATVIFILDGAMSSSDSLSVSDGERDFLPNRDLASLPDLVLLFKSVLDLVLLFTGCLRIGDLRRFIGDLDRDLDLCLCHLGLLRTGERDCKRLYLGRVSNRSNQFAGDLDLSRLKFCLGLKGDLERLLTPKGDLERLLAPKGDLERLLLLIGERFRF